MNRQKLHAILNDSKRAFSVTRDHSENIVDKDFIKALRLKRNHTQAVFASILGVSVKTIEKWEQGAIKPRPLVKKFLYLLDLHPNIFNDLYAFESHATTEAEPVVFVTAKNSFNDEFELKTGPERENTKVFAIRTNGASGYVSQVKSTNHVINGCCPAS